MSNFITGCVEMFTTMCTGNVVNKVYSSQKY